MSKRISRSVVNGATLIACCTLAACDPVKLDKSIHDTKSVAVIAEEKKQEETVANDVKKLDSGLVIETLKKAGTGAVAPTRGKRVTVHYTGTLIDGTKFDSSVDRGEPFSFTLGVGQVIKGWDEGVALMLVGDSCKLTIPAELAYGSRGAGRLIPPNATLIFEVELLSVA